MIPPRIRKKVDETMHDILGPKVVQIPARTLDDLGNAQVTVTYTDDDGKRVSERAILTPPIR